MRDTAKGQSLRTMLGDILGTVLGTVMRYRDGGQGWETRLGDSAVGQTGDSAGDNAEGQGWGTVLGTVMRERAGGWCWGTDWGW